MQGEQTHRDGPGANSRERGDSTQHERRPRQSSHHGLHPGLTHSPTTPPHPSLKCILYRLFNQLCKPTMLPRRREAPRERAAQARAAAGSWLGRHSAAFRAAGARRRHRGHICKGRQRAPRAAVPHAEGVRLSARACVGVCVLWLTGWLGGAGPGGRGQPMPGRLQWRKGRLGRGTGTGRDRGAGAQRTGHALLPSVRPPQLMLLSFFTSRAR